MMDVIDMVLEWDIARMVAYVLVGSILWVKRGEIDTALKRGNGVYQTGEVFVGFCLLFFILYSIEIIYNHHVNGDPYVLGIFVTGAGGSLIINKMEDKRKSKES